MNPMKSVTRRALCALVFLLAALAAPAQITNYPAGTRAVMVDTNGVIVAPTNFYALNPLTNAALANALNAAGKAITNASSVVTTGGVLATRSEVTNVVTGATNGLGSAAYLDAGGQSNNVPPLGGDLTALSAPLFIVTKDMDGSIAALEEKTAAQMVAAGKLGSASTNATSDFLSSASGTVISNVALKQTRFVSLYVNNASIQNNIAGGSTNWLTEVHNFNAYAGGYFYATSEAKTSVVKAISVNMSTGETPIFWLMSRNHETGVLATQKITVATAPTGLGSTKYWTNSLAFTVGTNSMLQVMLERVAGGNYAIWSPVLLEIEVGP